jgi:hypothetical protein
MKYKNLIFVLAILFLVAFEANAQGFPYDEYKPRTMAEIIKINADLETREYKQRQIALNANPLYSQVRVAYTGTSRPISSARKDLLKMWAELLGFKTANNSDITKLYENELLFTECGTEFWLPVQKQVIPYFEKELKKGEMVSLFMARVGGEKVADKWDWLFIVNEFVK